VTFQHLSCRILRDPVAGIFDLGTVFYGLRKSFHRRKNPISQREEKWKILSVMTHRRKSMRKFY
jgi:hypothetical protein